MATDPQIEHAEIPVQDLKVGMTITAYTGFGSKYTPLDEETCDWVKHNFRGATAKGTRSGTAFQESVANLLPGDNIQKISAISPTHKNICQVTDGLIEELQKRYFLRFQVQTTIDDQATGVEKASRMLETIKESINLCQNATVAVESLLDGARDSAPNFEDVKDYVSQLSSDETIQAVSAIISLKENDYVYAHCVDVGVIFQQVYFPIVKKQDRESAFKDTQEAMLAAFLHDIGKARIPKEILTSRKRFGSDGLEMQEIRKHPSLGADLLSKAGMPEVIVNMAHYHHVKLDETMTSSYPEGITQQDILFETRLLSLVDTYQALVSGRNYKKSWTPPAVMRYLDAIAGVEFDLDLWTDFQEVMGYYPIGSLVQLNDASLAFVINVPQVDLLKPQVAVVVDANGQQLEENRLIDLADGSELMIQKDRDSFDVFKDNALEKFMNLKIV